LVEILPEAVSLSADTFGGLVHVKWNPDGAVTVLHRVPQTGPPVRSLGWDCPLALTSPNAAAKRDILGTLLLAVLAGHQRYAHITALRGDVVTRRCWGWVG
jgi:hypothetical protein